MDNTEKPTEFKTFQEFYPFYLSQHQTLMCRRLHFIGTLLVCISLLLFLVTGHWFWVFMMPAFGYGFAWAGHYFYEKNKPATFTYPLYSLMGDFYMFWQVVRGEITIYPPK